jgi:hypothetical protein
MSTFDTSSFYEGKPALSTRSLRRAREFNWDAFLKKYIVSMRSGVKQSPPDVTRAIVRLLEIRKKLPCFEIDESMVKVLIDIGANDSTSNATEAALALIKPPYNDFIIMLDAHSHNEEGVNGVLKLHLEVNTDDMGNNILHAVSCLLDEGFADVSSYYHCIIDRNAINDDQIIGDVCFKSLGYPEEALGSVQLVCTLIYIGLCIALNQKSLYDVQEVPIKKAIYHDKKNKPYPYNQNAYKKLILSLKGQQHLEYLNEKRSGTKNPSRMHLRRGHFKQRRTGLFWWNPHVAGKNSEFSIEKSYKIKA